MSSLILSVVNTILACVSELLYYLGTVMYALAISSFVIACITKNSKTVFITKFLTAIIILGTIVNTIVYSNNGLIFMLLIAILMYMIIDNISVVEPKKGKIVPKKPHLTLVKKENT